ncbi:hypothetical protein METSMIALI_00200 [Methanobrevibacter smithii DSM 2375]|uniref:Uncharacterized protein n=1 Tax=Methanobrevibacter smithii DSM 2375 TaxID=483214 RepID=B9ACX8_METSM|nr:hypothetical protein METSMIALI_00200 [Methanobrevibacter smithii DSM 2375]
MEDYLFNLHQFYFSIFIKTYLAVLLDFSCFLIQLKILRNF